MLLQNDLVAHYKLDEGAGTVITDHGPNGYHGALTNEAGAWGRKAGDGSNILHSDSEQGSWMAADTLPFQAAFTAMVAFRIPKDLKAWNTNNGVISFRQGNANGWSLTHGSTGTPAFYFQTLASDVFTTIQRDFNLFLDSWIIAHVAFASGTLSMKLGLGPIETASGSMGTATGVDFEIGRSPQTVPTPGNDDFADVAIWSRVLSAEEMDNNVREVLKRVEGMQPPAIIRTGKTWPSTKVQLATDGVHAKEFSAFYNAGLWTDHETGKHYVATIKDDGSDKSEIQVYSDDWKQSLEEAEIRTATFNTNIGHRSAQVAVCKGGTVLAYPHGHNPDGWLGKHSIVPRNIASLTDTPDPVGLDGSDGVDYRRFKRHPTSGDIYMMTQGNTNRCYLHKFDEANKQWVAVCNPISSYGVGLTSYDLDFGWDSQGTLHILTAQVNGTGGYPRALIGMIKSVDETNWTDMRGNAITLPIDRYDQSYVFPLTAAPGASTTTNNLNHDAEGMLLAFDSQDQPIVVGTWRNELEYAEDSGYRDLWLARWNSTSEEFVRHRLAALTHNMDGLYGDAFIKCGGRLFAFVTPYNFHSMDGYADAESGQTDVAPTPDLELWVSDDDGATWRVYTALVNTAAEGYLGAMVDGNAAELGQLNVKFFPLNSPTADHVWIFDPSYIADELDEYEIDITDYTEQQRQRLPGDPVFEQRANGRTYAAYLAQ